MRKWSGIVTKTSNSLDLEPGVFTFNNPKKIAASLKKSSENSTRRGAGPYQSAMSMLNFTSTGHVKILIPRKSGYWMKLRLNFAKHLKESDLY